MSKNSVSASAPGNVFFFGEFAVIYGKPSIIASVDRRTRVSLKERSDSKVIIESSVFGKASAILEKRLGNYESKAPELYPLLDFLSDITGKLGISSGFELKIDSEVPVNSGMSSSTAVFCSVLRAVSEISKKKIDPKDYFGWVYPHQVKIHGGKASGSEIISSSIGGFNWVRKTENRIKSEPLGEHKFCVVIGDTKVSAPTALTVGYHLPSMERRYPDLVRGIFNDIENIATQARAAIGDNDIKKLGQLMDANQALLARLGMSHPKLDDCISMAREAGALGAKLSGGGWGGIMVALCEPDMQDDVMISIAETGANVIKTKIGTEGARIDA